MIPKVTSLIGLSIAMNAPPRAFTAPAAPIGPSTWVIEVPCWIASCSGFCPAASIMPMSLNCATRLPVAPAARALADATSRAAAAWALRAAASARAAAALAFEAVVALSVATVTP